MHQFNYIDLQNNLVDWAEEEDNVRALLLVGSRSRKVPPPDQFSDLDTILFCLNPTEFVESNDWLRNLGPFWFNYVDQPKYKEPEQFALYNGAVKIDVMIIKISESENLQSRLDIFPFQDVLQRGFKVLVDKTDSHSQIIIPKDKNKGMLPGQAEFDNQIHHGLLLAIKFIRYFERNDLWRANDSLNNDLRNNLLVLLEWEAIAANPNKDIWYDGRFIDQWGNPEVVSLFPQIFSGYQKENQRTGLKLFLQIYYELAVKIAEKLELDVPEKDFKRIFRYISGFDGGE